MQTVNTAHRPARKTLMTMLDERLVRLPVRVQIQPRLMTGPTNHRRYAWWRGTHWTFEAENLDELAAFRDALMAFFDLVEEVGRARTVERLIKDAARRAAARKTPIKRLVRRAVPERLTPAKQKALQEQRPKLDVL